MYFHSCGSMEIKMQNVVMAKLMNMAEDITWYLWRGFPQLFTLDR